jgi:hypothetical protein
MVVAVVGPLPPRARDVLGPRIGVISLVRGDLLPRLSMRVRIIGVPAQQPTKPRTPCEEVWNGPTNPAGAVSATAGVPTGPMLTRRSTRSPPSG